MVGIDYNPPVIVSHIKKMCENRIEYLRHKRKSTDPYLEGFITGTIETFELILSEIEKLENVNI